MGGCFKHKTFRVQALGWLDKKELQKKMNNSEFQPFQVGLATLEQFLYSITAAVDCDSL